MSNQTYTPPSQARLTKALFETTGIESVTFLVVAFAAWVIFNTILGPTVLGLVVLIFATAAIVTTGLHFENQAVSDLIITHGQESWYVSATMTAAEFLSWMIWLMVVWFLDFGWPVEFAILAVGTHLHHAYQATFLAPNVSFWEAFRHPALIVASLLEAVAGQTVVVGIMYADPAIMSPRFLAEEGVKLILLFGAEHAIGGLLARTQ